jgi:hypothetical protein
VIDGVEGEWSKPVTVTTAPEPPRAAPVKPVALPDKAPGRPSVTARASLGSIIVTWRSGAAGSGIKGYDAAASPGKATCTVGPAVQGCVLGAKAGVTYKVRLIARGVHGRDSAAAVSAAVTPVLPEVPATAPSPDAALTATVKKATFAIVGKGYVPYSSVRVAVYPKRAVLGVTEADEAGVVRFAAPMPKAAGEHTVMAYGVGVDGQPYALGVDLTVAGPELPVTGPPTALMLIVAAALILSGAAARAAARERRPCR